MAEYTKEQVNAAEAAFSKAAYALLAVGNNNADLITLMRVEANKVRVARRAVAKASVPAKKATSSKKPSAKQATTAANTAE